jgi:hypothetical protein
VAARICEEDTKVKPPLPWYEPIWNDGERLVGIPVEVKWLTAKSVNDGRLLEQWFLAEIVEYNSYTGEYFIEFNDKEWKGGRDGWFYCGGQSDGSAKIIRRPLPPLQRSPGVSRTCVQIIDDGRMNGLLDLGDNDLVGYQVCSI